MSDKQKLFILIDWFAPGYKAGGPIRSCLNLAYALRDSFQIFVVTTDTDEGEDKAYLQIESNKWVEFDKGINVYYFSKAELTRNALLKLLSENQPDIIYLNSMFSLPFTIWPLWLKRFHGVKAKYILAPRGMLHAGAIRYKYFKKRLFLLGLKLTGMSRGLIFQATDLQEAKDIESYFGNKVIIRTIANLPQMQIVPWQSTLKQTNELKLVFISRVSPKKNLDFLLSVLAKLNASISLDIIGPLDSNSDYWNHCEELIAKLSKNIVVRYLGPFPHHEVQKRIGQYHFFILPTHGENFGHAIFEAFAAGKPVIISDQTPWRELKTLHIGWDLPLEEKQFDQAIQAALTMNQKEYDTWSLSAWKFAHAYIHENALLEDYKKLFAE